MFQPSAELSHFMGTVFELFEQVHTFGVGYGLQHLIFLLFVLLNIPLVHEPLSLVDNFRRPGLVQHRGLRHTHLHPPLCVYLGGALLEVETDAGGETDLQIDPPGLVDVGNQFPHSFRVLYDAFGEPFGLNCYRRLEDVLQGGVDVSEVVGEGGQGRVKPGHESP